jgi:hypothetical protein
MLLAGLIAVGMAIAGLASAAPANAKTGFPDLQLLSTSDCNYGNTGTATFSATDLLPSNTYKVTISTGAGELQLEDSLPENVHDSSTTYTLDPGEYRAALFEQAGDAEWALADEVTFTIGACLELDLSVSTSCSTGADGSAMVTFTGLIPDDQYAYSVEGPATSVYVPFTASGDSEEVVVGDLPPGNFYVYVQWNEATEQGGVYDWRAFAIEPCQPDLTVTVTQCTVAGGTGTVEVALANLVDGVVYTVTGPDGSTQQATAQPSGVTNLTFPAIAAGTDSTVTVEGTWTVDVPYEEPPFIGGGDFVPLDTVALTASTDVTLDPCPAVVVPAGDDTTALPATGADPALPIGTAILLLGLGAAVLAVSRRRAPVRARK